MKIKASYVGNFAKYFILLCLGFSSISYGLGSGKSPTPPRSNASEDESDTDSETDFLELSLDDLLSDIDDNYRVEEFGGAKRINAFLSAMRNMLLNSLLRHAAEGRSFSFPKQLEELSKSVDLRFDGKGTPLSLGPKATFSPTVNLRTLDQVSIKDLPMIDKKGAHELFLDSLERSLQMTGDLSLLFTKHFFGSFTSEHGEDLTHPNQAMIDPLLLEILSGYQIFPEAQSPYSVIYNSLSLQPDGTEYLHRLNINDATTLRTFVLRWIIENQHVYLQGLAALPIKIHRRPMGNHLLFLAMALSLNTTVQIHDFSTFEETDFNSPVTRSTYNPSQPRVLNIVSQDHRYFWTVRGTYTYPSQSSELRPFLTRIKQAIDRERISRLGANREQRFRDEEKSSLFETHSHIRPLKFGMNKFFMVEAKKREQTIDTCSYRALALASQFGKRSVAGVEAVDFAHDLSLYLEQDVLTLSEAGILSFNLGNPLNLALEKAIREINKGKFNLSRLVEYLLKPVYHGGANAYDRQVYAQLYRVEIQHYFLAEDGRLSRGDLDEAVVEKAFETLQIVLIQDKNHIESLIPIEQLLPLVHSPFDTNRSFVENLRERGLVSLTVSDEEALSFFHPIWLENFSHFSRTYHRSESLRAEAASSAEIAKIAEHDLFDTISSALELRYKRKFDRADLQTRSLQFIRQHPELFPGFGVQGLSLLLNPAREFPPDWADQIMIQALVSNLADTLASYPELGEAQGKRLREGDKIGEQDMPPFPKRMTTNIRQAREQAHPEQAIYDPPRDGFCFWHTIAFSLNHGFFGPHTAQNVQQQVVAFLQGILANWGTLNPQETTFVVAMGYVDNPEAIQALVDHQNVHPLLFQALQTLHMLPWATDPMIQAAAIVFGLPIQVTAPHQGNLQAQVFQPHGHAVGSTLVIDNVAGNHYVLHNPDAITADHIAHLFMPIIDIGSIAQRKRFRKKRFILHAAQP